MTISTWPLNAINGNPAYAGRALRQTTNAPFLAGATAGRPLGSMSGVRPGTSTTTVTATSTTVSVASFAGTIDKQTAAEAAPYGFASDSAVSFTSSTSDVFPAADSTNPRTDIVYVQINDPSESDGSTTPGAQIRYLAGTAGASAPVPATPARSFVIAQVNVPKSGGGSPTVTWVAPTSVAAGGIAPVTTVAQLNALAAFPGAYADLTATTDTVGYPVGLYRFDGSSWKTVVGDTGWITPTMQGGSGTGGASNPAVKYRRIAGVLYLTGFYVPAKDSDILFYLPAGFRPIGTCTFWCERGSTNGPGAKVEVQVGTGAVIYRQSTVSGGTGAINFCAVSFPADA